MSNQVKNDKAIIMCGLAGLIAAPILTSWLIVATSVNMDGLTNRFLMIVSLFTSAPFGAVVGGFIGWLGGKVFGPTDEGNGFLEATDEAYEHATEVVMRPVEE
jgi:hypothetical protein